ncbi:MAG: hypothetical protein ACREOE_13520, partial [Gemmatimonadales bacterium]
MLALSGCWISAGTDCTTKGTCEPSQADGSAVDAALDAAADATVSDSAALDAAADASDANDAADAGDGFACDPTKSPRDEGCVVDEAYGVFVSAGGSDTGAGTKSDPVKTIGEGVAKAAQSGKTRVYVCAGSYAEAVVVSSSAVSLYGALGCDAGWAYVDGGASQVTGAANQVVLTIDGVAGPVAVEDLVLTAADASGQDDAGNGRSSVAAQVNGSTVTFRRCGFNAGAAANGAEGTTGSNYTGATAPDGQPNDAGAGGAGGSVTCADGTGSQGGNGGAAALVSFGDGGDGTASPLPMTYPAQALDGVGGAGGINRCGQGADKGAFGAAADGGSAAVSYGVLTGTGWTPTHGGSGSVGAPGQGGGGGGGQQSVQPLGGTGGGAGGCGGAGGAAGAGG